VQRIIEMKLVTLVISLVLAGLVAHVTTLDGILGLIAPITFETDTAYSDGYSNADFRSVSPGMSSTEISALLGEPFHELWDYSASAEACGFVWVRAGFVSDTTEKPGCPLPHASLGMPKTQLASLRGIPATQRNFYSTSPTSRSYRQRIVVFVNGRVAKAIARFYVD
jgi:hypothetical protein